MMMGTGSGAKQVNGEHSTRGNKKLTVAIFPLAGFFCSVVAGAQWNINN
ncbi:hypothetical protein SbBS512_E1509 [Shigella boydii CDC 3083-94]|nr:hypothetical protein SbBS512_E1509 [Shigella boydii CDC 3083-94]